MDNELKQNLEEEITSAEVTEETEELTEAEIIDEKLEAEVEELTAEDAQQPEKKGNKAWIFGILAVIIALAMIFFIAMPKTLEEGEEKVNGDEIVLKIGTAEFSLNEFNFMYISTFNEVYSNLYSYYGEYISNVVDLTKPLEEQMIDDSTTWHSYITDYTTDTLTNLTSLYEAAVAEGFVLPEEYQNDLDTIEEQLTDVATQAGMTLEEYLGLMYGDGITIDTVREMTEFRYVAGAYADEYQNSLNVTDDDIKTYYEANKDTIDTVDFRYYSFFYGEGEGSIAKDEAKDRADKIAATANAEEFNALAYEYSTEEQKEYFGEGKDPTIFPGAGKGDSGIADVDNWLFDSERKQGDTMVYLDEAYSSYLAIMFESRNDPDYNFVDVRHVLITPEEAEDGTVTDEAWEAANTQAEEAYAEYLAGEMTEEAFSELVKKYSKDGNASEGGIYEDVYKGQMVSEFEDWCFDETRIAGDTGIVKTQFGYHIMYFVGEGENNLISLVKPTLINEQMNAWIEELSVNITAEKTELFEKVGGIIDDIINAANERAQAQASTQE